MLEIRKTRTTARNLRCNGQCERFNRTLISMIKSYLCNEQTDWDLYLGCLAGAYRATPNEATTLTPNMMTLGREIRMPAELIFGSDTVQKGQEATTYGEYVTKLRERMQRAHDVARKYLKSKVQHQKDLHDVKLAFRNYRVGDIVWYQHETKKVGVTHKLERLYDGPFLVSKKLSEVNFEIMMGSKGPHKVVHHNKLKPFEGRDPPKWIKKVKEKSSALPTHSSQQKLQPEIN